MPDGENIGELEPTTPQGATASEVTRPHYVDDYDRIVASAWEMRSGGDLEGANQLLIDHGIMPDGLGDGR